MNKPTFPHFKFQSLSTGPATKCCVDRTAGGDNDAMRVRVMLIGVALVIYQCSDVNWCDLCGILVTVIDLTKTDILLI